MQKLRSIFKMAFSNEEFDFTTLPLRRAIFVLAIPMIIEMMMESIFAVVDAFFVGRLGDLALATVGLTESALMVVYSVGMGISMAATAMVARRFGEKNFFEAGTAAFQLITTGVFLSLTISILTYFYAENILEIMGASAKVIAYGSGYTRIIFASNIAIVLLFLVNGIFRGAGSAKLAMKTLILANGINLLLDPLFIFGFGSWEGWGLEGAAIATATGRSIGILFQLYHLLNGKKTMRIIRANIQLKWNDVVQIFKVSVGGMGQFLIDSLSWILIGRIIAEFGDSAVASYTVAFRVIVFTILPSWGLAGAAATLVGQNLGAQNYQRAEDSVWMTAKYNMIFLGLVMVLFMLFGNSIAGLFTDNPKTIEVANLALTVITLGYVFFGLGMVMIQAFNGAGDTKTPMYINIMVLLILEAPLAYFLSIHLKYGPIGVFSAIAICHSLHALVSFYWFRKGRWKQVKI
jgi:putative MATE family efflux protein